ncbi:hypothetical protein GGR54DRAFT_894 [Hypoxylon sp. NC1633]|nr:hypothetical protein GGR54DRAFT_894 [Hypoxylon sp. NC1633]
MENELSRVFSRLLLPRGFSQSMALSKLPDTRPPMSFGIRITYVHMYFHVCIGVHRRICRLCPPAPLSWNHIIVSAVISSHGEAWPSWGFLSHCRTNVQTIFHASNVRLRSAGIQSCVVLLPRNLGTYLPRYLQLSFFCSVFLCPSLAFAHLIAMNLLRLLAPL